MLYYVHVAAQGNVCRNTVTIDVNTNNASLVTDQTVPLPPPDNCVIWEIQPSDTTGFVAVEILEIFDNPPDVQLLAILYPSSQNRLFNNALISSENNKPLFYIPAQDNLALELKITASGSSSTYGFLARISLVNETGTLQGLAQGWPANKNGFRHARENMIRYIHARKKSITIDKASDLPTML